LGSRAACKKQAKEAEIGKKREERGKLHAFCCFLDEKFEFFLRVYYIYCNFARFIRERILL